MNIDAKFVKIFTREVFERLNKPSILSHSNCFHLAGGQFKLTRTPPPIPWNSVLFTPLKINCHIYSMHVACISNYQFQQFRVQSKLMMDKILNSTCFLFLVKNVILQFSVFTIVFQVATYILLGGYFRYQGQIKLDMDPAENGLDLQHSNQGCILSK